MVIKIVTRNRHLISDIIWMKSQLNIYKKIQIISKLTNEFYWSRNLTLNISILNFVILLVENEEEDYCERSEEGSQFR